MVGLVHAQKASIFLVKITPIAFGTSRTRPFNVIQTPRVHLMHTQMAVSTMYSTKDQHLKASRRRLLPQPGARHNVSRRMKVPMMSPPYRWTATGRQLRTESLLPEQHGFLSL